MDTETIEKRSLTDLQQILGRLGGWPVVEGEDWQGEGFLWHELSISAAEEGFDTSRIISIGQAGNIDSETLVQQQSQVCPPTPRTLRGGLWRWTSSPPASVVSI